MAKRKKQEEVEMKDDFTLDLIKSLNKEHGSRVAYNLSCDESPTHVKRWISTGSKQLDFIISNRRNGGLPEGRIVEILDLHLLVNRILQFRLLKVLKIKMV